MPREALAFHDLSMGSRSGLVGKKKKKKTFLENNSLEQVVVSTTCSNSRPIKSFDFRASRGTYFCRNAAEMYTREAVVSRDTYPATSSRFNTCPTRWYSRGTRIEIGDFRYVPHEVVSPAPPRGARVGGHPVNFDTCPSRMPPRGARIAEPSGARSEGPRCPLP